MSNYQRGLPITRECINHYHDQIENLCRDLSNKVKHRIRFLHKQPLFSTKLIIFRKTDLRPGKQNGFQTTKYIMWAKFNANVDQKKIIKMAEKFPTTFKYGNPQPG